MPRAHTPRQHLLDERRQLLLSPSHSAPACLNSRDNFCAVSRAVRNLSPLPSPHTPTYPSYHPPGQIVNLARILLNRRMCLPASSAKRKVIPGSAAVKLSICQASGGRTQRDRGTVVHSGRGQWCQGGHKVDKVKFFNCIFANCR